MQDVSGCRMSIV